MKWIDLGIKIFRIKKKESKKMDKNILTWVSLEKKEIILKLPEQAQTVVINSIKEYVSKLRTNLTLYVNHVVEPFEKKMQEEKIYYGEKTEHLTDSYLSVADFAEKYDGISRSFIHRKKNKHEYFRNHVLKKVGRNFYVNIEAFWKWMEENMDEVGDYYFKQKFIAQQYPSFKEKYNSLGERKKNPFGSTYNEESLPF